MSLAFIHLSISSLTPTFLVSLMFDAAILNLVPSIDFIFNFGVGFGASRALALGLLGLFS